MVAVGLGDFDNAAVALAELRDKRGVEVEQARSRACVGDAENHVVFVERACADSTGSARVFGSPSLSLIAEITSAADAVPVSVAI